MSLYDCPKCWEIVCICGHEYREWTTERLVELRSVLDKELERRTPT